jgi:hypothetical protein
MSIAAMTFPTKWISLDPKDVAVGPPLFRSVLLLFGVLPVDLQNLALLSLIPSHDNSKNEQTAPTSFKYFPRLNGLFAIVTLPCRSNQRTRMLFLSADPLASTWKTTSAQSKIFLTCCSSIPAGHRRDLPGELPITARETTSPRWRTSARRSILVLRMPPYFGCAHLPKRNWEGHQPAAFRSSRRCTE